MRLLSVSRSLTEGRFCYNCGRKLNFNDETVLQKGGPLELSVQTAGPGSRQGASQKGWCHLISVETRAFDLSTIDPLQLEKIRKESERNMNKTSYLSYNGIEAAVSAAKYSEAGLGSDLINTLGGAKPAGEEVRESKRLSFFRKDEAAQQAEKLAQVVVEKCHLLLVGSTQTGKTCLIEQYLNGHFLHSYTPTVKDEFTRKVDIEGAPVDLTITDMAGFEEYDKNGVLGLDSFDLDEAIRTADGLPLPPNRRLYFCLQHHFDAELHQAPGDG